MDLATRFWSRVDKSAGPEGCWPWTGAIQVSGGYGRVKGASGHKPEIMLAHRLAWEIEHGEPVPKGKWVLHHCDNPPCCNPLHLYAGGAADNMRDAVRRGRRESWPTRLNPVAVKVCRFLEARGVSVKRLAVAHGVDYEWMRHVVRGHAWVEVQ